MLFSTSGRPIGSDYSPLSSQEELESALASLPLKRNILNRVFIGSLIASFLLNGLLLCTCKLKCIRSLPFAQLTYCMWYGYERHNSIADHHVSTSTCGRLYWIRTTTIYKGTSIRSPDLRKATIAWGQQGLGGTSHVWVDYWYIPTLDSPIVLRGRFEDSCLSHS